MQKGDNDQDISALSAKELKKRSRDIDKMLRNEQKKMNKEVVLLMLGPGRSGKSTFCKQMKILHLFGFTENEREMFKWIVQTNTIDAILDLIEAANKFGLSLANENKKIAEKLYDDYRVSKTARTAIIETESATICVFPLEEETGLLIKTLWEDKAIRDTYERRDEFSLGDAACYYLNSITRIADDKFVPNDLDILRARVATTSVVETTFEWEQQKFRLVDVGGQRGERKKWLPLFSDVTAVIFCVAMNEYDIMLEEDDSVNRMHDSLELWTSIVNNKFLKNTPMILFLNKEDLFREKIERVDLRVCFPEYKGGKNFDNASKFLLKKFKDAIRPGRGGKVYPQITQATDTRNIQLVWQAIKDIFIQEVFENIL